MSRSGATALPTWSSAQKICFAPDVALSQAFVKLQQPTTVPIANLVSTPKVNPTGDLIDVSSSYIVYGVKNGLVRIIDRNSAARTLLRGHEEPITDVAFFGKDTGKQNSMDGTEANVVATVSGGGAANVLIWRVLRHGVEDMTTEKLLEIHCRTAERIIWHPFNPNQLVLSHRISVNNVGNKTCSVAVASYIVTTNLTTEPHKTEGHAVCFSEEYADGHHVIPGSLQLVVGGLLNPYDAMIQDMCWSQKDTRHVLTAHFDGYIRLWDLRTRVVVTPDGDQMDISGDTNTTSFKVSAKCLFTVQVAVLEKISKDANVEVDPRISPLQRCMFLPQYDYLPNASVEDNMESWLTPPFITSTQNGSIQTLWTPFSSNGPLPSEVKRFELAKENEKQRYQVALLSQPSTHLDKNAPSPSTYLLLADEVEGYIYALHLASVWSEKKTRDGSPVAIVTGFDYIVPFQSLYPIYSFCARSSESSKDIDLFCVQSKAIQMLSLTASKCSPPPLLSQDDESLPPGVNCIYYNPKDDEKVVKNSYQYEDFDDFDETQNARVDDMLKDQDDNYDELETPLDASSDESKSEHGDIFTDSVPVQSHFSDGVRVGTFSNWLGSLASIEPQGYVPPTPQVTPLVKSKPAHQSLLSGIRDLSDMSLPSCVSDSSTATPVDGAQAQSLLSPMEFLTSSSPPPVKDLERTVVHHSKKPEQDTSLSSIEVNGPIAPVAPVDIKKDASLGKKNAAKVGSVVPAKQVDQKVTKSSSSKEALIPKIDGKLSILKREGENESKESVKPSLSCSAEECDVMIRKAVASQFKQQESTVVMEIQKSIRSEMQSFLLPSLNKTIAQSVEQSLTKVLAATVTKQMQEASSTHVKDIVEAVKEPIHDTFYLSMRDFMIPAFESATKQMFGQISSTLQSGLTSQNHDNGRDDLLKVVHHMAERMDSMSKMIEVLISSVNQLTNGQSAINIDSEPLSHHDPKQDLRDEILNLINVKEYERAFTQALSLSDAEFALLVCKSSDLSAVLEGEVPCLSQPILLCLMQQLGTNITSVSFEDAKFILAWLQSIAIILDPNNESIKKHVMHVCAQVMENINRKLLTCDSSLRRPLQTLLQVIRGIGTI